jgi:hypothetical protein
VRDVTSCGEVYLAGVFQAPGLVIAVAAAALLLAPAVARADESWSPFSEAGIVRPPPLGHAYVQYGVAFTVESVAAAGPICSAPNSPCILGSGGGISVRVGYRPGEELYIGGAYEFSKQDPNNLYRLGILQQARAELRRYFPNGSRTNPFAMVGVGVAGYGDEWSLDTWGLTAALGGGLEFELSSTVHLGLSLVYRPVFLAAWVDSSTTPHDAGVAHLVGLELALEAQDRVGERRVSRQSP